MANANNVRKIVWVAKEKQNFALLAQTVYTCTKDNVIRLVEKVLTLSMEKGTVATRSQS